LLSGEPGRMPRRQDGESLLDCTLLVRTQFHAGQRTTAAPDAATLL
jgi:hypothetical protein